MSLSSLPPAIQRFLRAAQAGDGAALRATLHEDAVLTEDGREYRGHAIDEWVNSLALRRVGAMRPINEAKRNDEIVVTVRSDERGANGGDPEIQRNWHFTVRADRVAAVRFVRRAVPTLPPAISAYVRATNSADLEGLLATFVDDAHVNDQLCEHWGKQAIREWAAREIIDAALTMYVVNVVEHYGQVIVTANINGNFDSRGLPDPLVFVFYFSASGDRIVQLIILPNQLGA
jgi:hypothetical protein